MANIRVDLNETIKDGSAIMFRSPVDCSAITGLIVYYVAENGAGTSKEFVLADAHGHNVGDIDHLFAENAVVKVILDVTVGMAYVQNADTNAYIERTFIKTVNGAFPDKNGNVEIEVADRLCIIDATNGWDSIDQTFSEIQEAYDAGRVLVLNIAGHTFDLVSADNSFVFERYYVEGNKDEGFKLVTDSCSLEEDIIFHVPRASVIDIPTNEYVNELVKTALKGADSVCVIDATNGWDSIDQTFSEIQEAYDAGRVLVLNIAGHTFDLVSADNSFVFERYYVEGTNLVVDRCSLEEDVIFHVPRASVIAMSGEGGGGAGIHIGPNPPDDTSKLWIDTDDETADELPTDDHINELIDAKLGVIENGTY